VAEAERRNGDATPELLTGLLTFTPASAGIARTVSREKRREDVLMILMHTAEERVFTNLP
jgi:hypothetical protein